MSGLTSADLATQLKAPAHANLILSIYLRTHDSLYFDVLNIVTIVGVVLEG